MPKLTSSSSDKPKSILSGTAKIASLQISLPTKPSPGVTRFEQGKYLIVAPPGWGKTELALSIPDLIMLCCEEGHKFVSGFKMVIDAWDGTDPWIDGDGIQHCSFVTAVSLLIKDKEKFKMIGIDTVDALVKMLLDFTLGKKKAEHATDLGEYGKGWDVAQNSPFRRELNRIVKSGRGILAITHEEIKDKNLAKGPVSKKDTSLPTGIYKQIYGQFDIILHGKFGRMRKPNKTRDRLLISEGGEHMLAKNRGGYFPPGFVVPQDMKKRWPMIEKFFQDEKARNKAFEEFEELGYDID